MKLENKKHQRITSIRTPPKRHILLDFTRAGHIGKRHMDAKSVNKEKIVAMTQMASNIAHRWRQPLNALAIMVQDLKHAKVYNELTDEYLESMCTRSMGLINRMSKTIDEFRLMFEPAENAAVFDVKKRLQRAVWFASDSIVAQGIKIEMRCRCDVAVFGYPDAFSQAVLKILANAKEALIESSRKDPRISINMGLKNGVCVIKISNNGPRIDDEHLSRIFEPYYTTKEQGRGDEGLGLYAVKMLIEEAMGGEVLVISNDNSTTVQITLLAMPQQ